MFYFFITSLIITSSIVVISARNPLHSILGLISVVINIVVLLILLEAEFLALIFVAVYLGAVTVLFLFIVMMLNIKGADLRKELIYSLPIGSFMGLIFLYFLYNVNIVSIGVDSYELESFFSNEGYFDWVSIIDNVTNIEALGSVLYTFYAPLLLIVGIILLIAMIGAVILTQTTYIKSDKKRNFIDQQVARNFENAVFLINEKKIN